jgi:hypothetical protein
MQVMKRYPVRVYADTSVFGGVFDEEFKKPSRIFFEMVKAGKFQLVTSVVVQSELSFVPPDVRAFFNRQAKVADMAGVSEESIALRNAYIKAGIVTTKCLDDALHVALATISGCGLIVSWNFKHIVNFKKIPLYNGINGANGYPSISIHSPLEVISDEK